MDGLKLRAPAYPLAFLAQISESHFIECNQSRAKIFYEMNGQPDATVKAKHFYASAKELLSITRRVLDEIGVRFWISSGTCLGKKPSAQLKLLAVKGPCNQCFC